MYFDPDWIFTEKPGKDFPNITGLMGDPPKKQRKKKRQPVDSLADVFAPPRKSQAPTVLPTSGMEQRTPPVSRVTPITSTQIQTETTTPPQQMTTPYITPVSMDDRLRTEYEQAFNDRVGGRYERYSNERPSLILNKEHQDDSDRYYRTPNYNGRQPIRLIDNKYNIRNNLTVSPIAIDEIKKYARAGNLTPDQTLLLAAISSNESEFGATRDLFGINDMYQDFPGSKRQIPGSYEAKQMDERYTGDFPKDLINFVKRKTDNFQNLEEWNSNFKNDKLINPRGETYTDRIRRNAEILMSNPEFMKAMFGDQLPQLTPNL